MKIVHCPECQYEINLDGGEVDLYFECDECVCGLIITSLDPPKIEIVNDEK